MSVMPVFYDHLKRHIESLGQPMSFTKLSYKAEIPSGHFSLWKSGKRGPSENDLRKLAEVKELGLGLDVLQSWKAANDYPELADKILLDPDLVEIAQLIGQLGPEELLQLKEKLRGKE